MSVIERPEWQVRAACRGAGPDLFFPPGDPTRAELEEALSFCAVCPVVDECHEWWMSMPLEQRREGIWANRRRATRKRSTRRGRAWRDEILDVLSHGEWVNRLDLLMDVAPSLREDHRKSASSAITHTVRVGLIEQVEVDGVLMIRSRVSEVAS